MRGPRTWVAALLALACARPDRTPAERYTVGSSPDTGRAAVQVIQATRTALPRGLARLDLQVLLGPGGGVTQMLAQNAVQHVIDSLAARDSTITVVRAVGYLVGAPGAAGEAEVIPVLTAAWLPVNHDSLEPRGLGSFYRTQFTLLRPLP